MNEIGSVVLKKSDIGKDDRALTNQSAKSAVKELLKNGILVETNKGLVCMSLKGALNSKIGGHSLSVKNFQSVAAKLLGQEEPEKIENNKETLVWINKSNLSSDINKNLKPTFTKKTNSNEISKKFSTIPKNFDTCRSKNKDELNFFDKSVMEFSFPLEDQNLNFGTTSEEGKQSNNSVSNRSLIVKSNMKSVISVHNLVMNLSNEKKMSSDMDNFMLHTNSVLIKSVSEPQDDKLFNDNCISCEEMSDNSEVPSASINKTPVKKRGGWPKGRKRKPETKYEIRPPKAPATGYVIFLNKRRKEFRDIPFTEVTKLLGNEWSKLSLEEKRVYLDQAEVEKKRYREELKLYRQSDAYQTYLLKKRLKRIQGNGTEESDMDATDEIDEEDNEELYCRSCDQWFHSLHNKKEHLYGRLHLQSLGCKYNKMSDPDWSNANMSSTSLDESSLDGSSYLKGGKEQCCNKNLLSLNMDDSIVSFMIANKEREEERTILRRKLVESKAKNQALTTDLQQLNDIIGGLTCMVESEKTTQILLEQRLFNLLNVPTLFYLPEPLSEENNE